MNACKGSYSARTQKCIKYFTILFQGSNAIYYAWKIIYLIVCLKYIQKPNFLYVFSKFSTLSKAYI